MASGRLESIVYGWYGGQNPPAPVNARSKNAKCKRALDTTLVLAPLHGYLCIPDSAEAQMRSVAHRLCEEVPAAAHCPLRAAPQCASKQCAFSAAERLLWLSKSNTPQTLSAEVRPRNLCISWH